MEQLFHDAGRVGGRDRLFLMHRAVAQAVDQTRLLIDGGPGEPLETRLVQQRRDVVLIGQGEARIVPERPFDRDLDRFAGEEHRRGGRAGRLLLSLGRRLVNMCKFRKQESEVGHGAQAACGSFELQSAAAGMVMMFNHAKKLLEPT